MKTSDFDYQLNLSLIAQKPTERRDHSRLLIYSCASGEIKHKFFKGIVDYFYFYSSDVLVM